MSKKLRSIALPIVSGLALGPVGLGLTSAAAGAAIGSGAYNYSQNHDIKSALLSGVGSYAGGKLAGNVFGDLGTAGGAVNKALGTSFGQSAANALPNAAAASLFSTPLNSIIGSQIGSSIGETLVPQTSGNVKGEGAATAYKPSREAEKAAPPSLQSFGSLSPDQLSSNLATGGVYGGGQGPEEQDYFLNMMNRRLIDDSGNVDENLNEVNPIESSYLAQLGLGGYSNAQDLLQAISRRRQK